MRLSDPGPSELLRGMGALVWEGTADGTRREILSTDQRGGSPGDTPEAPDPGYWWQHVHPADRALLAAACRAAVQEGGRRSVEYRLVADDGAVHWYSDVLAAVHGPGGALRLRGLTAELGDRHVAAAVPEVPDWRGESFDDALRLARIGHFTHDLRSQEMRCAPQVDAFFGFAPERAHPFAAYLAVVHPDDVPLLRNHPASLLSTGQEEFEMEYRVVPHAGRVLHLRALGRVVRDEAGVPVQVFGTLQDVTGQRVEALEQQAHLWFLDSLREVEATLHHHGDLAHIVAELCTAVRRVLACDAVCVLGSADDDGIRWRLACCAGPDDMPSADWSAILADAGVAACLSAIRGSATPVHRGPGAARDVPHLFQSRLHVRSLLGTTLQPRASAPMVLVAVQQSHARTWTAIECQLLEEIGRRLADTSITVASYQELRESERRLAESQRISHVGYWERDVETGAIRLSEETLRIIGVADGVQHSDTIKEVERLWRRQIHRDDRARVMDALGRAWAGTAPYDIEYRIHRFDGALRDVRSVGTLVRDDQGRVIRLFGTVQDITELRNAERELHLVESRFRALVDHASDAFYIFAGSTVVDANARAVAQLGYPMHELIGLDARVLDGQLTPAEMATITPRLAAGEHVSFETLHRRKDGSTFPVEVRIRPLVHGGQVYSMCLVRDLSDRIDAERRLRESHSLMEAIIGGTPDIVYVIDRGHRCVMINSTGARLLEMSVESMIGRPSREIYPGHFADGHIAVDEQVMQSGAPAVIEGHATFNGVRRFFTTSKYPHRNRAGEIIGMIGVTREMTDYKRLEEQLVHSQKMEAVGQLAGGIAHDFNNLLTVIISYCELLLTMQPASDPGRELVAEIRRCGERAATLTSQLLTFSRKQRLSPRIVNLYAGIGEWRRLVRPLVREDIEIDVSLAAGLHSVRVDPDQLEQALTNLVVNARDAMPDGGLLRLAVDEVEITPAGAPLHGGVSPGRYARIVVADTGQGIPDAVLARVFEPFFTTKPVGKGTGLGLAMVYGFVRQSGGHVTITSEVGVGTRVSMFLPSVDAPAEYAPEPGGDANVRGGSETVLLVEDERVVRTLSRRILEGMGYTVLEAFDGEEALAVARSHRGRIDIVVTDVVMPRLNGRRMAAALRADNPMLRVLFVSGYAGDMAGDPAAIPPGELLQKPFTPAVLARRVRELLDAPPPVEPAP
ncbi:MAG: PAS domain S-box protein [Gemmatimonadaceae bacterium]|nr:PAS domain S-box protein [Gemmatimonadaceae bacterium]